jgi:hypothetical protein
MRLHARCEMSLHVDVPTPLIAMLRPRSGHGQWVVSDRYTLDPMVPIAEYVDVFGNLCQRLVAPKGAFSIRVATEVEVSPTICVEPSGWCAAIFAPESLLPR